MGYSPYISVFKLISLKVITKSDVDPCYSCRRTAMDSFLLVDAIHRGGQTAPRGALG